MLELGVSFDDGETRGLALDALVIDATAAGPPQAWLDAGGDAELGDWLREARTRLNARRRWHHLQQAQRLPQMGDAAGAARIGCELLETDACDEQALGQAMRALADASQPAQALALLQGQPDALVTLEAAGEPPELARRFADSHILIDSLTLVSDLPIRSGCFAQARRAADQRQINARRLG